MTPNQTKNLNSLQVLLFTLGVLRASTVYFRCREEQSDGGGNDRCDPPSEFHMPIGNLGCISTAFWFFETFLGKFLGLS